MSISSDFACCRAVPVLRRYTGGMGRWISWLLGAWTGVVLATGVGAAVDARRAQAVALAAVEPAQPAASDRSLAAPPPESPTAGGASAAGPLDVAPPVAVEAPSVGLAAPLVPVGKTADGALAVPEFGTAGWYRHSVRPGAVGAAVLAGHVDSTTGPDVFFPLRQLEVGDAVLVRLADGTTSTFVVKGVEVTDKEALPVGRIFDQPQTAELRLITCGGAFDRASGSYESNVIVYATLAAPPEAPSAASTGDAQ